MASLSKEELYAEIEKGYRDAAEGKVEPAEKVFDDLRIWGRTMEIKRYAHYADR